MGGGYFIDIQRFTLFIGLLLDFKYLTTTQ